MIVYDDTRTVDKLCVYDKGITVNHDPEQRARLLAAYRNGEMIAPHLDTCEALGLMARDFVDAISQKRTPASDGYAGHRVVRLLEAAQKSMESNGHPVELNGFVVPREKLAVSVAVA
jgi:predicted dehydrogenase